MSLTYAIPDLHGRLDLLDLAIARIAAHSAGKYATVVTLGDYIDRGSNSRGVVDRLMNWKSATLKLVHLKGNHEAMMWQVFNHLAELEWWIENGGDQTLASYGFSRQHSSKKNEHLSVVPRAHLDWMANLALIHVDRHRVFVHAAVDPATALDQQSEQTLLWKRYPPGFHLGHGHLHVVHGHVADRKAPIVTKGRTNLDAMAWKTGRLVVGVFDEGKPGGASEFWEIVGPA